MGADKELKNNSHAGGEPVADLEVKASSLSGIECLSSELASVGDDLPLLLLAMASAQSESSILGIDRIPERQKALFKKTVGELIKAGADISMSQSDVTIAPVSKWYTCELDAAEHPALALALMMLSLRFDKSTRIKGCRAISTAFPELIDQARRVGIKLIEE
jgi:3-phosphoshikimate 1-carboxyvinyltransferase